MNKRQKKKRNKIIELRMAFFRKHIIYAGRMNGKSIISNTITKACWSKKYKPFNDLKKIYKNVFVSVDYSNGRDFTAVTRYIRNNGVVEILGTKII